MRIAYVCADPGVPVFGWKGSSVHVQEVIRALVGQGHQIELFATRWEGAAPTDLGNVIVRPLPPISGLDPAQRERAALAANPAIAAILERQGPFALVYERYSLWNYAGMEYARANGIPGLLEVNAPLIEEQTGYRVLEDRAGAESVAERVFAAASLIITVSREIAAHLERYPAVRGRIHVVPNGINPQRFPAGVRPTSPAPPGIFTVGFVGSLKSWHGLPTLVAAFALHHQKDPACRLLLVGDGPERATVAAEVEARGLIRATRLAGAVPPQEVPGLLASMDVAVAPYPGLPRFYFSPLKVLEYMAAGLPVVASRIGQLAELIHHGRDGILCPAGDTVALAQAFEQLRVDPELRGALGKAARAKVLRDHTWEAKVLSILARAGLPPRPAAAEGRDKP
jgi:glycosyltransferase involved in cell wall biosynthesis